MSLTSAWARRCVILLSSLIASQAFAAPPPAPTWLSGTGRVREVELWWTGSAEAEFYKIFRDGVQVGTATTEGYRDGWLRSATTYEYFVVASNADGDSPPSNTASFRTSNSGAPGKPLISAAYALSTSAIQLSWGPGVPYEIYEIFRDGVSVGTSTRRTFVDNGLQEGTAYTYTLRTHNDVGSSPLSDPVVATSKRNDGQFVLDGVVDFPKFWIMGSSCGCGQQPALSLHAAMRGSTLYLATSSPGPPPSAYDYFIFVTDALQYDSYPPAPWAKSGVVATPPGKPFIGAEGGNDYVGWFNAPAGSQVARSPQTGRHLEATIDVAAAFGRVPETVFVAVVAYESHDGGHPVSQIPFANVDSFISASEFLPLYPAALRDENSDGRLDRMDPMLDFRTTLTRNADGTRTIRANAIPARSYVLQYKDALSGNWLFGELKSTARNEIHVTFTDTSTPPGTQRFYRVHTSE